MEILNIQELKTNYCDAPCMVRPHLHPSPYIILNPAIPDTRPADYYTPQEADKVLVIMGPSSAFLLALIGVSFILIYAGPVAYPECPENQEYNYCGSACPANCSHPDPPPCIKICKEGCFCKKGYLDDGIGGCVKQEECRACTEDRTYNGCGTACPDTCSNWNQMRICTLQCVSGCFCKPGLVILSEGGETRCVLPRDCPPVKKQ
ncbi:serine protease inhibitor swm-1-like [Lithobates pipiens]